MYIDRNTNRWIEIGYTRKRNREKEKGIERGEWMNEYLPIVGVKVRSWSRN